MKIHDKFVIELAEVIKGYGNDYRVKGVDKLPCDYKFYEISGVAICEESFKKMKPLNVEINNVLDKIRAEIENKISSDTDNIVLTQKFNEGLITSIAIIDKYRKEEE